MAPNPQQKTLLGQVKQSFQQTVFNFVPALKPNARVPKLLVQDADDPQPTEYPLLGEQYSLGRDPHCNIVLHNQVVSGKHLLIERDRHQRVRYILKDNNSTNGIYRGKKRIKQILLKDGDRFTLGSPDLAAAVKISFRDPAPWYLRLIRYGLYGVSGITGLLILAILIESTKYDVTPLPEVNGPIVVYDDGLETTLRPPRTQARVDMKSLNDFSPHLPDALIASEDARFYWHFGVDPFGVLRALVVARREGELTQGASTLTQQVARSLYPKQVGRDNSLGRKLREAVVSMKLEAFYSKDDILRTYLNRVFLGGNLEGFEDASRFYFGKSVKNLNLSESATLVGMLPAPNAFNPCANYSKAIERRNLVLNRMVETGAISQDVARNTRRSVLNLAPDACKVSSNTKANYAYSYVFQELDQILGKDLAREGNFIVETGIDLKLQNQAELALNRNINSVGRGAGYSQGGLITIDYRTGLVKAMVGGVDYQKSQFNRATEGLRQPGSTFKLFAYAATLEKGVSPGKSYSCDPVTWQGQTFRGCEHGAVGSANMFQGFALSENNIALRVAQDSGLPAVIEMAKRLGIRSNLRERPGLVLGESEVTVLDLTGAYAAVANRGVWNPPRVIKRVYDSSNCKEQVPVNQPRTAAQLKSCAVIYDVANPNTQREKSKRVLKENIADTLITLMRGVITNGTGKNAAIGQGEGGKTGTTNDNVDMWFVGSLPTQNLTTGIWLGNDRSKPTRGSSAEAARVWGDYMRQVIR